jgi:hypothetical protein
LKLKVDNLLSIFAFNLYLHRYTVVPVLGDVQAGAYTHIFYFCST